MLERLKRAHYGKRFGRERAERIILVERELANLPSKSLTREWIEWFWELPEEAWPLAIARLRERTFLKEQREIAVQAITRKNRLLSMIDHYGEFETKLSLEEIRNEATVAAAKVEQIKSDVRLLEEGVREATRRFRERFGPRSPTEHPESE